MGEAEYQATECQRGGVADRRGSPWESEVGSAVLAACCCCAAAKSFRLGLQVLAVDWSGVVGEESIGYH